MLYLFPQIVFALAIVGIGSIIYAIATYKPNGKY